jgi:SAM-dependent methyltransferase
MNHQPVRKLKNFVIRITTSLLYSKLSSERYWKKRYQEGSNSGAGSYGHLADFKADVLNRFVSDKEIGSVIEFGCGDGNQLSLSNYPRYVGYDISDIVIKSCRGKFKNDNRKDFELMENYDGRMADLCLFLDVIFHLLEDTVFESYMMTLFSASKKYVVIYSSNTNSNLKSEAMHVRHRKFTDWIEENLPQWKAIGFMKNRYPYDGDYMKTSFSDFYFYKIDNRCS